MTDISPPLISKTDVDLAGLIEVLGENLYSTPIVAVRELIQNSYDACIRRRIEGEWSDVPRIDIQVDPNKNTISISDNGSGLTRDEITKYLATLGRGYTRNFRKGNSEAESIGYFGLGFISAFVIAEQVTFATTSFKDDHASWIYKSDNGQRFTITEGVPQSIGSIVTLNLKSSYSMLTDHEFLDETIRKYCCLLPIDIYINSEDEPANGVQVPWKLTSSPEVHLNKVKNTFARMFDDSFDPLATALIDEQNDFSIQGMLWIQDGSYYASSDNRVSSIFVRGMHVTDDCKEILPEWAGFFGCVIDTTALTPTASRETIQENENYQLVKEVVRQAVIDTIRTIATEKSTAWRRMQAAHNQTLLGAALSDNSLFESMQYDLTVPTTDGDLSIPEILQRSNDKALRISLDETNGNELLIIRSMGIPVISGEKYAAMPFCKRFARDSECELLVLGSSESNAEVFKEETQLTEAQTQIPKCFEKEDTEVVITRFEPAYIPLVQVYDQDALLKKRIESRELDRNLGAGALMLARTFSDTLSPNAISYTYVNLNNPIIERFPELNSLYQKDIASILLGLSDISTHQTGSAKEFVTAYDNINKGLNNLTVKE